MKKLLLHSCCAPCSSAVLERLVESFNITIYYYNPNIDTKLEFMRRREELEKLSKLGINFNIITEEYVPEEYNKAVKGLENLGEGSERCYECYKLRLLKTATYAKENSFDYFATTLSISPYKNSKWLSEIGNQIANKFNVNYLDENFKKKDGYKHSQELSYKLKLYKQNYCGCKYSKTESLKK